MASCMLSRSCLAGHARESEAKILIFRNGPTAGYVTSQLAPRVYGRLLNSPDSHDNTILHKFWNLLPKLPLYDQCLVSTGPLEKL